MKTKKTKPKTRQPNNTAIKAGIYGIDATKASIKITHGSELTSIVK